MPTPSAPDPHSPYTFSSTCPEPDESSRQQRQITQQPSPQHEPSHVLVNTDDEAGGDTNMPSHAGTEFRETPSPSTEPITASPYRNHTSDGLVPFTEADDLSNSPLSSSDDYHNKPPDDDVLERPRPSSYALSPVEPLQPSSRPRQGVGTSHLAAGPVNMEEGGGRAVNATKVEEDSEYVVEEDYVLPSMGSAFSNRRVIPDSPSSFLRAGSRFTGTQQSERQVYQVQVEIKYVDLRQSFLCGYLRIQGLTDDHPTLTTYFEGEIIGSKYSFLTKHADWGANDKTDLSHWAKFPAFRPYSKQARRSGGGLAAALQNGAMSTKDVAQSEHIFMRWKEHFLVPDHRVRTITGASFEGFYYICFNQVLGEVNGIYFHSKSERFQQLELSHVEDRGCFSALEFR